jgi:hypothetical protein
MAGLNCDKLAFFRIILKFIVDFYFNNAKFIKT